LTKTGRCEILGWSSIYAEGWGVAFSGLHRLFWSAVTVGVMAAAAPACAEDSINDLFKDFVVSGCIDGRESGIPIDAYAQGLGLAPANPQLAAAFLRGRPGSAYIKPTPQTVLIIAETADVCTVATRAAPDLPGLTQTLEIALTLLKSPFTLVKEEQRPVLGGGVALARIYEGAIGTQIYGALLSTTETGSPQATVTVYRKGR
jgi:hypothetical protein